MRIPRALVILASAVVLVVGGAIAYAAIPNAAGVFTACITKSTGAVRIIDPSTGATCKSSEMLRTWNRQGQPGTDGVSGYEIVTNIKSPGVGFTGEGAFCPEGKHVLGGGAVPVDDNGHDTNLNVFNILDSAPGSDGTYWSVTWTLTSNPFANNVRVYAICADVAP